MPSLQEVLASIPGLAGYQAQVNQNNATGMQTLQMAQGAGGILAQIQAAETARRRGPLQDALLQSQVDEHTSRAKKLAQEAEFNARLMQSGGVDNLGPDQLDAFAAKAALMNHPGALGMAKLAEQKRAQLANKQALGGMQSQAVADAPVQNEADAIAQVQAATDAGQPASVGFGENPNVIPRKQGGVADYLTSSPYVGSAAKQLQARIDAGALGMTPQQIEQRIANLDRMHTTMAEAQKSRDQTQSGRIEIKNMFPPSAGRAQDQGVLDPVKDKAELRDLAIQSLYDPGSLAGFRRDTKTMGSIQRERIAVMKEAGVTSEDVVSGRAGFKADSASLNKITPQYDAITSFDKTAIRNGKILVELADKVDTTGVPVVERWIRAGRKSIGGDPDVAKFDAQMNLYRAEAARILTQPNLTGVLTDTARKEMEHVIGNSASATQIREVVSLLERDFNNRKETLEEQIGAIRARMRSRVAPNEGTAKPEERRAEPRKETKRVIVDFSK